MSGPAGKRPRPPAAAVSFSHREEDLVWQVSKQDHKKFGPFILLILIVFLIAVDPVVRRTTLTLWSLFQTTWCQPAARGHRITLLVTKDCST